MPFLFDDDEERRRRLLTPGINGGLPDIAMPKRPLVSPRLPGAPPTMPGAESPSALPESPIPRLSLPTRGASTLPGPMPSQPMDTSGVGVPIPSLSGRGEPTPYTPMGKARYDYVSEGRDAGTGKYRRSAGDILKNTALGFLRGVGSGNGLAGGVGGALTSGITAAVSPRLGRERLFEDTVRPGLERDFAEARQQQALQQQAEDRQRSIAMGDLKNLETRTQIGNIQDQVRSRKSADERAASKEQREANQPLVLSQGQVAVDRKTGKELYKGSPKPATDAEVEQRFFEETGDTVESLSQKSLAGRIPALRSRLTAEEQRLAFGGAADADDPQAISRAQAKWEKIQSDELNSIRRDTAARIKAQYRGGSKAQSQPRKGQPGRRAISVSEAAELLK